MQMEAVIEMIFGKREFRDFEEFKRYAAKAKWMVDEVSPSIIAKGISRVAGD